MSRTVLSRTDAKKIMSRTVVSRTVIQSPAPTSEQTTPAVETNTFQAVLKDNTYSAIVGGATLLPGKGPITDANITLLFNDHGTFWWQVRHNMNISLLIYLHLMQLSIIKEKCLYSYSDVYFQGIICELILTYILVQSVLMTAVDTNKNVLAPLAIGLTLTLDIFGASVVILHSGWSQRWTPGGYRGNTMYPSARG